MSGVAWQIPLQAGQNIPQFGPDPQKLLNEQVTAAKLAEFNRQTQQDQQGQNALKQLYANPDNFGPDGTLKPEAIRTIGMADPAAAQDLRKSLLQDAVAQTQLNVAKAKFGDHAIAASVQLGRQANAAYDEAAKTGGPAAGQAAGTQVWSQGLPLLAAEGYPPEYINNIPKNYDRNRIGRIVSASDEASLTPTERFNEDEKLKEDNRLDIDLGIKQDKATTGEFKDPENIEYVDSSGKKQAGVGVYDRKERDYLVKDKDGNETRVTADKVLKGNESTNPKAQAYAEYKSTHPNSTAEDDANFIKSMGAGARSAPALAVQTFIKQNPDATPGQITGFAAKYGEATTAARAFGSGQQGNQVRSLGAVANHFDTLTDLGTALENGDNQSLNKLKNTIKTEFGYDQVPNFNLAKKIVGDEVVKAVIGSGAGGVTDRAALQADFDAASSPTQLNGVIGTAKKMIVGQFDALRQQYNSSTFGDKNDEYGFDSFDSKLTPGAKTLLGQSGGAALSSPVAAPKSSAAPKPVSTPQGMVYQDVTSEQYDSLPSGAHYTMPGNPKGYTKP